ncbi:tetratricopeptide repeat protein [Bacillus pakistanensis]
MMHQRKGFVMNYVEKMISTLEEGNLKEAEKYYKRVKSLGTDEDKFYLAEELYHLGFLEEAKELFEGLLKKFPGEGELVVLLAETLVEMNNEEEAMSLLSGLNEKDPEYPRALLLLADLYQMQGLFEVSEQKLIKAKSILPYEPIIDFALGELYSETGRFLEALRHYQELIKADMKEVAGVQINQRIAESLSAGGAFEEALIQYEEALEDHLEINTLFGYAFTAFQAGFYQKAIEKFNAVKELDPDYHSVYLLLAKAYEREEDLKNSLQTIKEGIKHDEYNKEMYFFGGKIALKLGEEEEAEKLLRESLAIDQGYLDAALTLNKLFQKQDRFEDILEIVNIIENEGEEDPQLYWDSAVANQGVENYKDALKQYQRAYTFFKEHPEFLKEYGDFLVEEGRHQEAMKIYQQLLNKQPSNDEVLSILERLQE